MSCNCNKTSGCDPCDKLGCGCLLFKGDTLSNINVTEDDDFCEILESIDSVIGDLTARIEECCGDSINIDWVAYGEPEPDNVPTGNDPLLYLRDNGEVWAWNKDSGIWELKAPVDVESSSGIKGVGTIADPIRENFGNLPLEGGTISEAEHVVITNAAHPDGARILYSEIKKTESSSGIQGNGLAATPIKENFDNLPTDTALEAGEFFIASTATYPDGAKIAKENVIGGLNGVTLNEGSSVESTDSDPANAGIFISITPNGSEDTAFTLGLNLVNSDKVTLSPSTSGVTNTLNDAKVEKRWNGMVAFSGFFGFTNAGGQNLLLASALDPTPEILLTNIAAAYRPSVTQQFPALFGAYESVSDPVGNYNAIIRVQTNGDVYLRILDLDAFYDASQAVGAITGGGSGGGANGFDIGNVWLSNVKYYTN